MYRSILSAPLLLSFSISGVAHAASDPPHECEAESAPLMDLKSSWPDMYAAAVALPRRCFDGYFAEGISDTLVRKMGSDWSGFISLLTDHPDHAQFLSLVLDSVNATLDPKDVRVVQRLSLKSCPSRFRKECGAISRKTVDALVK